MNDDTALVEASIERLFAVGEDRDTTWVQLDSAGMMDALLSPDRPFEMAGAIVRVAARHDVGVPLADAMLVTWLADHAGIALRGRYPALALAGYPATAQLVHSGDGMRIRGILDGVSDTADGVLCVLPHEGQPWLAYFDHPLPRDAACNLAGEPRQTFSLDVAAGMAAPLTMDATTPLLVAAYLRSAQMLGAMERCLSLSTRYAADRHQFGRPIMQFQAVQHLCAEIAAGVAAARVAVAQAAAGLDRGCGVLEVLVAKSRVSEVAGAVAAAAHQIHGAIGFTSEYPLGIATRRLWSWRDEFGDEAFWNGVAGNAAIEWQTKAWSNLVDGSTQRDDDLKRILSMAEFRP